MKVLSILLGCILVLSLSFGQTPPMNLQTDLMQGGEVVLTWDAPPDGLVEDFEDGIAQDFLWEVYSSSYSIDEGFAKVNTLSNTNGQWGSGVYSGFEFDNFTVTTSFEYVAGSLSRGLLFRGNGAMDDDYIGYGFWITHTTNKYSMWKYDNGNIVNVVPWSEGATIFGGPGAMNTLSITAIGDTFDMYVNGEYVGSVTDSGYSTGYVGFACAYHNEVWFDDITSVFEFTPAAPEQLAHIGTPSMQFADDLGRPVTEAFAPSTGAQVFDRFGLDSPIDELDDFIEYRIYRNGSMIGTSLTETYSDMLTVYDEYEYTVTAYYDEGESSHAGPVSVNFSRVSLDLIGQIVNVPAEGGNIFYDAHLVNHTSNPFFGVNYWIDILLPNGQTFSPVGLQTIWIPASIDTYIPTLLLEVPDYAPEGTYLFTGNLGFHPISYLNDSFEFSKADGDMEAVVNADDFIAGGRLLMDDATDMIALPSQFAISDAWPNPFNPSTSVQVTLPEAAELEVSVYNIHGQHIATLANGQFNAGQHTFSFDAGDLASGLYFVKATVPGQLNEIRKVTLLR